MRIEGYAEGDPKVRLSDESPSRIASSARHAARRRSLLRVLPSRRARARRRLPKLARLPFSLKILLENLLRFEDGSSVTKSDIEALARWTPRTRTRTRDRVHAGARAAARFHRRSVRRRSGGDARCDGRDGRRSEGDQSAAAGRARHRSLGAGRLLRHRTTRWRRMPISSSSATASATRFLKWGQSALRGLPRRAARTRASCIRSTSSISRASSSARAERVATRPLGLSRYGRRHRFAHDDGQRSRRARVGRRRHRSRSRDARPAGDDAHSRSHRLPVGRRAARRRHRDRSRADGHRDAAQEGRRRKVRRVLRRGLSALPVADRTTIGNMSPEFGSTVAIFPIDDRTLEYLRLTGRSAEHSRAGRSVREGARPLPHRRDARIPSSPIRSRSISRPSSRASPDRAGRRIACRSRDVEAIVRARAARMGRRARTRNGAVARFEDEGGGGTATIVADRRRRRRRRRRDRRDHELHEHVESVGADRRRICWRATPSSAGCKRKPWVKTSLAPGSKVVTDYLDEGRPADVPRRLGFNLVGYGCTTCIGNSGPLPRRRRRNGRRPRPDRRGGAFRQSQLRRTHSSAGARELSRVAAAGRRVRAGRAHGRRSDDRAARHRQRRQAGLSCKRSGRATTRSPRRWRGASATRCSSAIRRRLQRRRELDASSSVDASERYEWDPEVRVRQEAAVLRRDAGAAGAAARRSRRARARRARRLGDDRSHLAGRQHRAAAAPPAKYLMEHGIEPQRLQLVRRAARQSRGDGARNVRQRALAQRARSRRRRRRHALSAGERADVDLRRVAQVRADGTPLIVLAGKEYGSGSSRDWAAKGPYLLGIKAVIAESFERIHRSNLIGMGVLPLEYLDGADRSTYGLDRRRDLRRHGHRRRRRAAHARCA